MKLLSFLFLSCLVLSCAPTVTPYTYTLRSEAVKFQIIDLTDYLQPNNLKGQVLIFDEKNNQYYSNDFSVAKTKFSPASTFKIVNTLIGLETGTISENHVFPYKGEDRRLDDWKKDLVVREALQVSCVPCYQELARMIGVQKMNAELTRIAYPGMKVTADNLDQFWLRGESKISPLEQIDFLRRLNTHAFDLKPTTLPSLKKILQVEKTDKGILYAKTGLSMSEDFDLQGGWYVGFIEKNANRIYFATYLQPGEKTDEMQLFRDRIEITKGVLNYLHYY